RGRPPAPIEVRRLRGRSPGTDSGGRRLPPVGPALPAAASPPDPPADLGTPGGELWSACWSAGAVWLSPATDRAAVERACRLVDSASIARTRYSATTDRRDARTVLALSRELGAALSALGF